MTMVDYAYPDSRLLQFARSPVPGRVKSRLQPVLGEKGCLALHCRLVEYTHRQLQDAHLAPVEIWYSEKEGSDFFRRFSPAAGRHCQWGLDLGERMHNAFDHVLSRSRSAVMVGSDCPFVGADLLGAALGALAGGQDAVFGPASDGGYYLVGLARAERRLFTGIDWGTGSVMAQTRLRLRELGWRWRELPTLADIDRPEDLPRLAGVAGFEAYASRRKVCN